MSVEPRDLYAELGVTRQADAGEIKAAYRNLAKTAHPDKGGTDEAFARLTQAYQILSDPEKRAKYDATGEVDEPPLDLIELAAIHVLSDMLAQIIREPLPDGLEIVQIDLRRNMLRVLDAEMKGIKSALRNTTRMRERAEKLLGRFARDAGDNAVEPIICGHVETLKVAESRNQRVADVHQRAIDIMKAHTFRRDPVSAETPVKWRGTQNPFDQFAVSTYFDLS